MRKSLVYAVAAAAVAGGLAAPALAACPTDPGCSTTTVVGLTVTDTGVLSIAATPLAGGLTSAPLSAAGTSTSGLPVMSGPMTLTTVQDGRLNSTGWTVTATAGPFTAAAPSSAAPIPAANVSFTAGTPTSVLGSPALTPHSNVPSGGTLITAAVQSPATTIGPNTVTYTPTVSVTIPSGSAVGTLYTSIVTQSVS